MTDKNSNVTDENSKLDIRQIYLKDFSFESPQSPQSIIAPQSDTSIDINMRVSYQLLDDDGNYEIVLTITVTAKKDEAIMFLSEIQQAGLFQILGFGDKEMGLVLNVACPTILLPYARAAITDVVSKGGFPQLLLTPVNFDALYARKLEREKAQNTAEADEGATIN